MEYAKQLSENATKLMFDRYVLKNSKKEYMEHSFEDVARRLSRVMASKLINLKPNATLADMQATEKEFYSIISTREFLPNSPTIFNAGKGVDIQLLSKHIDEMTYNDYKEVGKQSNNRHNMYSACFVNPIDDSISSIFQTVKEAALTQKYGGGVGFNFSKIRPHSTDVAGTGGIASGPVSFMHVISKATETIDQGGTR